MSIDTQSSIILFAHGARDPEWARPIEALLATIMERHPDARARTAFLEFMSPTLETAIDDCVASGSRHITIVPVFLAQGGHLKRDVPHMMERARTRHPGVILHVTGAIGEQQEVIDAMAIAIDRLRAVAQADTSAPG